MKYFLYLILLSVSASATAQTCRANISPTTPTDRFECGDGSTWYACNPQQSGADQVHDKQTGLVWQRCPVGQTYDPVAGCVGTRAGGSWGGGLAKAGNSWRLPNIAELLSISELACYSPAINLIVFPSIVEHSFWSSSPTPHDIGRAYGVSFTEGGDFDDLKSAAANFRLVRDGF